MGRWPFSDRFYDHFKCTQLNTGNMMKISNLVVQRMEFQIDTDALNAVLTNNGINGRKCGVDDKSVPETYQSVNDFAQKFNNQSSNP